MTLSPEFRAFGLGFLRTATVFAETCKVHSLRQRHQDVSHLTRTRLAELSLPLLIRDHDHHPAHHPPDLIRHIIRGDVIEAFLAVSRSQGRTNDVEDVIRYQAHPKREQRRRRVAQAVDFAIQCPG